MQFAWTYEATTTQQVKAFLKTKGVSKGLLAKIKFQGGLIEVNQQVENVLYQLHQGDQVTITIPDEGEHETLLLDDVPIEVVFEDEHLLIVNKPADVASIPAQYHPNGTMANRVKNYLTQKNAVNRVIHVVTRLDRDTTGLMLFAKHGFAHALLDQQLREKQIVKKYQALVTTGDQPLAAHEWIKLPIARDLSSIIKRQTDASGKAAETEYWTMEQNPIWGLVKIQLHTGRTHQIRVHFEAIGAPLLGDSLYGGNLGAGITRQALHCGELSFIHPFTREPLHLHLPLPADMAAVVATPISDK